MGKRPAILLAWFLSAASACTLPGLSSPTPFTFPTPNLTLTVIFAPTETPVPVLPTLPPLVFTNTPAATSSTLVPGSPTAAGTSPSGVRPNGAPGYAPFLATAPTVDGNIQEWTTISYVLDQCTYGCSLWSGISDSYATYFWGWDNSFLYLAVKVVDDRHVPGPRGSRMYRGDIVEVQFDADLTGDFSQAKLSLDDLQLGLSPGDFASLIPEAYRWYPVARAGTAASVRVRAQKTDSGYMLEASLPWTFVGATPSSGSRYGFALSLSDNDLPATAIQQSLVSSVRTRKLFDPTTWGTLILQ